MVRRVQKRRKRPRTRASRLELRANHLEVVHGEQTPRSPINLQHVSKQLSFEDDQYLYLFDPVLIDTRHSGHPMLTALSPVKFLVK